MTGAATEFSVELAEYLQRCRAATELPLAERLVAASATGLRDDNGAAGRQP